MFLILGARPARSSLRDSKVPPSALEEGGGARGHEQDGGAQPRHRVRADARAHGRRQHGYHGDGHESPVSHRRDTHPTRESGVPTGLNLFPFMSEIL